MSTLWGHLDPSSWRDARVVHVWTPWDRTECYPVLTDEPRRQDMREESQAVRENAPHIINVLKKWILAILSTHNWKIRYANTLDCSSHFGIYVSIWYTLNVQKYVNHCYVLGGLKSSNPGLAPGSFRGMLESMMPLALQAILFPAVASFPSSSSILWLWISHLCPAVTLTLLVILEQPCQ